DRWRKTSAIHRHAVAERGGFIARVANMIQLVIPAFDVRAIRRFLAAGNRNVTILSECEKRRFARQRIWRSPVRRKPDKSRPAQIQRENRIAISAVQMQTKKCEA